MNNITVEQAKQYMEEHINMYKTINFSDKQKKYFEYIFNNGQLLTHKVKVRKCEFGKMGHCYYNAQMYAIGKPRVKYYEGWAITKKLGLPLEHGFNVLEDKVFDNTWNDGLVYFGLHIPTNFVSDYVLRTGWSDNLLGRYVLSQIGD